MSTPRNPEQQLALIRRRERVAQSYLEGNTPSQIAENLGLPIQIVRRDLRRAAKQWIRALQRDVATSKSQEVAKIDRLEAAAWQAWERSYRDDVTSKAILDGEKKRAEKTTRQQAGDPKFLDRVAWCIEKRCELLSLTDPSNAMTIFGHVDNIPLEQRRRRVVALLDLFRERERAETARLESAGAPGTECPGNDPPAPLG